MSALKKNLENIVRIQPDDDLKNYVDTLAGHGRRQETVVEVDRDDDLTSVRSKLESAQTPRVIMVLPSNAKTLKEALEYRILRRLQRELGLDLILIIKDHGRRSYALENGFRRVFPTLNAYYKRRVLPPELVNDVPFTDPEEFAPSWRIGRAGLIIGGLLAATLAILALLAIPVANVTIYPDAQLLSRDVDVLVEIGGPRVDTAAQRLSGRPLQATAQSQGTINVRDVPPSPSDGPQPQGFQPGVNVTLGTRDALREQLLQQAIDEAKQGLRAQLQANESLPDANIRIQVAGEKYDRNLGDVAPTLGGSIEVVASGMAFNNDDFNQLVFSLWSQDIPRGYRAPGNPNLTPPAVLTSEGSRVVMRVRASGPVGQELDAAEIAGAVRGRSAADAQKAVSQLGSFTRPAEISLWPSWASRAFRVRVDAVAASVSPVAR